MRGRGRVYMISRNYTDLVTSSLTGKKKCFGLKICLYESCTGSEVL